MRSKVERTGHAVYIYRFSVPLLTLSPLLEGSDTNATNEIM